MTLVVVRAVEMKQDTKNIHTVSSKKVISFALMMIAISTLVTATVVERARGDQQRTLRSFGSVIVVTPTLERGVNWIAASWAHTEQDLLERDFVKFEHDELTLVSLQIHLVRLMPTNDPYYYDDTVLDNLIEACQKAHDHDLKVLVTMYTSFDPTYGSLNPPWMQDPCDGSRGAKCIVGSDEMAQYYKDAFTHIVDYLVARSAPVWAWAVMNEPFAWCGGGASCPTCGGNEARRQRALGLFRDMSDIVKSRAPSQLVTCRFIPQIMGDRCWRWDPIIFDAFDILMMSGYNYANYYQPIYDAINGVHGPAKSVYIYEFGTGGTDDAQAQNYRENIAHFIELGVSGCFAFEWVPNASTYYNICNTANGDGRPAYYELAEYMK